MFKKFAPFLLPLFASVAQAQLSQIDMTEKEVHAFLSGNSIGARDWLTSGSYEYHSPDGQTVWREGEDLHTGRYAVKGSQVCYIYEPYEGQNWFCWIFRKERRTAGVYQWDATGDFYRLYIHSPGDVVSEGVVSEDVVSEEERR